MTAMIRLKVVRPLYWSGTARAVGGILSVDAMTASQLVSSGRAKLVDPADLVQLTSAEQEHTASVCRDSAVYRVPRGWATR